jgi:hypothetical protein
MITESIRCVDVFKGRSFDAFAGSIAGTFVSGLDYYIFLFALEIDCTCKLETNINMIIFRGQANDFISDTRRDFESDAFPKDSMNPRCDVLVEPETD